MSQEQHALLMQITQLGFCLDDVILYLDTHPDCPTALSSYPEVKKRLNKAREQYNTLYGPLTSNQVAPGETWSWIETPLPWE